MTFPIAQLQAYNQAEITIHRVCQLLALTGVNLVPKKDDDSHTNLAWDDKNSLVAGRYFQLNNQTMRLVFAIKPQELRFETKEGQLVSSIDLSYSDHETLVMWWRMQLQELGASKDLIDEVHYDLPETEAYTTVEISSELAEYDDLWMTIRRQANQVFNTLNTNTNQQSEIRIWPHHFDTGVYYSITGDTQAIGAGMAIADTLMAEPYYYIYAWSKDTELDYSAAPDLGKGKWLTGTWKGAVLPISSISNLTETAQVDTFYTTAYDFLLNALKA